MNFFTCLLLGFVIAASGSITPSFLNITVVKFSLKSGRKSALYLIGGFATVLFFQANIGAYLSSVLMKNSEYITNIQKIGTGILFLISIYFFRLHFISRKQKIKVKIKKSKAYLHGIGMSLLNTFAIPFYFTSISFLIVLDYFEYSFLNGFYFSVGSTIGSFSLYALYATVASKIEHKLTFIATKMDFILGCLTGVVAIGNLIYLL
ncbi:LysE family transporter [Winogradskyella thalassocola]|uniref:Threonine/homoserine/homoserine lactone efflux protein n=1 Tax=Winogradskyella thalassocola TaxID=262004 RepID=A0A1G8HA73_9FLAO|nr:LysE family transporter [Winogradskyella thalassocola]SDI03515.1 Threonine/homoserine/homoserine lactone efflux protein [Winogradskyella thalassocola]